MRRESTVLRGWRLAVAVGVLGCTRLALTLLPYRLIIWAADHLTRRADRVPSAAAADVARRVTRAARLVPGATCLPQAIAAAFLLARQGHEVVVRFGVRRESATITAHAWVEHEGAVLVGGPDVSGYVPLQPIRRADVR